jgi:hypothetical protein
VLDRRSATTYDDGLVELHYALHPAPEW